MEGTIKKYTIETDDDRVLRNAIQAESLAYVLYEMDSYLRGLAKYDDCEIAETNREYLRLLAYDNDVSIDGLLE